MSTKLRPTCRSEESSESDRGSITNKLSAYPVRHPHLRFKGLLFHCCVTTQEEENWTRVFAQQRPNPPDAFLLAEAVGKSAHEDDSSPWGYHPWERGGNLCPDKLSQTNQSTGVAIFSHCGKKPAGLPLPIRTQKSAHSTGSSRLIRSETYKNEEDSLYYVGHVSIHVRIMSF